MDSALSYASTLYLNYLRPVTYGRYPNQSFCKVKAGPMAFSPDILNSSILIVDDRETDVAVMASMLRGGGYVSVSSTTHPLEVCDLHRRHRYDLILLDVKMPEMDGFQVMEALKEREKIGPGESLPVLVITAKTEKKKLALQAGAKGFIAKPFDQLDVLTNVRDVLEIRLLQKELHES